MVQTSDELLTVREAARLLKVSPYTIYRWISAGRLPGVRYSPRVLRLRRSDVERMPDTTHERHDPPRGSPAAVLSIAGLFPGQEFRDAMEEVVRSRGMTDFTSPFDELPD